MDTTKLISLADFEPYKAITSNINEKKYLDIYILEAQEFDLKPLLGRELYLALVADYEPSPSFSTYSDLFYGIEYTYSANGKNYRNPGLIPILCYFAYARAIQFGNVVSTAHGFVQKKTDESMPAPSGVMGQMTTQAREAAFSYWKDVKLYLDHHVKEDKFKDLWNCSIDSSKNYGLPGIGSI